MAIVKLHEGQCNTCGGLEYLTGGDGEFATARACPACASACGDCRGKGMVIVLDEAGYEMARKCGCQGRIDRVNRYNACGIPARYHGKSLETFEEASTSTVELKYGLLKRRLEFQPGDPGMLLWGRPGTGKTHLMTSFFAFLTLERGLVARFVDFGDLTTRIKRGYDKGMSENEIIDDLVQVPILCVDELGKGRGSDWEISVLDALVNRRYNAGRSTFFTTNYPLIAGDGNGNSRKKKTARNPFNPQEIEIIRQATTVPTLEERVGSRIFSRLNEMCEFKHVIGEDYRQKGKSGF